MEEVTELNHLGLTLKQDQAAMLEAYGGMDRRSICETVKISPTTFYKWLKKPEFVEAVDMYKHEKKNLVKAIMLKHVEEAVEVQLQLLKSDDESIRLKASDRIIQNTIGKPKSNVELTTNMMSNNNSAAPKDILEMENEEFERRMLEEFEEEE